MIRLDHGDSAALIDETCGGRLASLKVFGAELIVGAESSDSDFGWGMYPMVPFAGRVRNGRFNFQGKTYQLAKRMAPHAIHGTVDDTVWEVVANDEQSATMRTELGPHWPFAGAVEHTVEILPKKIRFELVVTVAEPMPAQVGWHPWFVRPARLQVDFAEMYVRDDDYIATARRITPTEGPWDDCFTGARRPPEVAFNDGVRIVVESDCDHWVVYDMPKHALCVEPQSGPPDGFTLLPHIVTPTRPLRRTMTLHAYQN